MRRMTKKKKKEHRGGYRGTQGRKSLFPGKWEDGSPAKGARRLQSICSRVAVEALDQKREELSTQEGRSVTESDSVEWCIRKALKVPMGA